MLEAYRQHVAERAALGVPPKPLDDAQTADLVELLKNPPAGEEAFLVDLLENRLTSAAIFCLLSVLLRVSFPLWRPPFST